MVVAHARPGVVERAVRAELRARGISVQSTALAAAAVGLARRFDREDDGKAAAALAGQLRAVMSDLAKATPVAAPKDGLDEIRARREARRPGA